jgi:PAS domain S-box-containing protein
MILPFDYGNLDQFLEGCQIIGFDWSYIYINKAAEKQNRRPASELIGKKYSDIWPGIESTDVYRLIKECLEERISSHFENCFTFPDGDTGWYLLSIQPIPEGAFILSINTTETTLGKVELEKKNKMLLEQLYNVKEAQKKLEKEILSRKKTEEALQLSEEKFITIFEKNIFPIVLSNQNDGILLVVNKAFEQTFGYSKLEAIGKTTKELGINPDDESRKRILESLKLNGNVRDLETALLTKKGEKRLFSINIDLIEINKKKYILNILQDITEKKEAENNVLVHLRHIQALHKIDKAITGSLDLDLTLHVVLEQVMSELHVDAATVLLLSQQTKHLKFGSGMGFKSRSIEKTQLRLGEGYAGQSALAKETILLDNLPSKIDKFARSAILKDEGFVTYFVTPLIAKGSVVGVLEVFNRNPFSPDENWVNFFKVLAGQTAIAVDNDHLFTELRNSNEQLYLAYDQTIEGWSHALDLRDKETEGHTLRVTELTLLLAMKAGIREEEMVHVRRGALLHDIGKMGVPDSILLKPDKLSDDEWVEMRKHPTFAFELLSPISYLIPALDIPYCHHEKWDGTGYPRGLKGDQIPLIARLFAIVDVWDALRSDRPYRKSWPKEKVIEHIKSLSGSHFDPNAVDLFLKIIIDYE